MIFVMHRCFKGPRDVNLKDIIKINIFWTDEVHTSMNYTRSRDVTYK